MFRKCIAVTRLLEIFHCTTFFIQDALLSPAPLLLSQAPVNLSYVRGLEKLIIDYHIGALPMQANAKLAGLLQA